MRINKDGVASENYQEAQHVLARLRAGDRVFGNPAEGLKKSLMQLERDHAGKMDSLGRLDFALNDADYKAQCSKLKNGIKGEEELAQYLSKLVRYDAHLQNAVVFASLSIGGEDAVEEDLDQKGYIPDSDFLLIWGKHALVMDAKALRTNPEIPLFIEKHELKMVGGKPILEIHPSNHLWMDYLRPYGVDHVDGCTVIVNQSGATIFRNPEWSTSPVRPLHISELYDFLMGWTQPLGDPEVSLNMLAALSKAQIRKGKLDMDTSDMHRIFKI